MISLQTLLDCIRTEVLEAVEPEVDPDAVFPAGSYECNNCGKIIELTEEEATAIEGVPYCGCDR